MTRIELNLPMPPSLNSIWRHRKTPSGRLVVYPSISYQKWKRAAGQEWMVQKPRNFKAIDGPFRAKIILYTKSGRTSDIDNRIKVVLDLAQSVSIVKNDSNCRMITTRYGSKDEAPMGAKLIIESL